MRQHLLVGEGPGGRWRLSGLVDFEPAMRGEREYEFVAVGVFVAEGDARFLTQTLTAYGYPVISSALSCGAACWPGASCTGTAISPGGCGGSPNRPGPLSRPWPTAGSARSYPASRDA
jgi:hypothetical protein